MSGGFFDYADSHAKYEIFGCTGNGEKLKNVFEDREISELIYDVFNLIHDFDWYKCGDTERSDWLDAKRRFKKKWFSSDCETRIKEYAEEILKQAREEISEMMEGNDASD